MGILEEIQQNDLSKKVSELPATKVRISAEWPDAPCLAGHPYPYGLHHWKDPYGQWHCTECNPPSALSMVRDEIVVHSPDDPVCGTQIAHPSLAPFFDMPGIRIIGVQTPAGDWLFSPTSTTAERRSAGKEHFLKPIFEKRNLKE